MQQRMQQNKARILEDYEELIRSHWFELTKHAEERLVERNISWRAVVEILECYEPVEWADVRVHQRDFTDDEKKLFRIEPYRIVVSGESELYDRRPIAVVCSYGERPMKGKKWDLHVLTAYALDMSKWSDLSQRLCFCSKDKEMQQMYVQNMLKQYCKRERGYSSSVAYSTHYSG